MMAAATRPQAMAGAAMRPRPRLFPWLVVGLLLGIFALAPAAGFLSLMGGGLSSGLVLSPTQAQTIREMTLLLVGVAVLAGSMGLVSAWLVTIHEFPLRRVLEIALVLPLAFPTYLAAYVAVDLLDFFGPVQTLWRAIIGAKTLAEYRFPDIRSLTGAIIVLSLVLFPYVYVSCRLIFSGSGRNVIDAARLLGARGFRLFATIGLPLAVPALAAGLVLVMLETINDLGATEHLGISSFSIAIRDLWLNRSDLPGAARMAGIILAVVALLTLIDGRKSAHQARGGRTMGTPRAIPLHGLAGWGATFLTGMPVLLGFVLPTGFLAWRAILYAHRQNFGAETLAAAASSLVLAIAVSAGVMLIGGLIGIALRITPRLSPAGRIAAFGYAIPGTVLVLSVFPVLRWADSLLTLLGVSWSVAGTFGAIVFALLVRFAGIGAAQARLALGRLPTSIDQVARIHGMSDARLALRVHLPAMLPGLMMGGILVFIDTIKELPATLLLRPLNFETLATRAYAQASAGTFEHAALESLVILALSGCAALMLVRR